MSTSNSASPATDRLDSFIRHGIEALERGTRPDSEREESLLFLGAWSDALPRMLIEDPVLAPTDKIVWQVIKLRARAGSATAFPSYQTIGRLANVRSQAPVARAIALLRISCWLTLCARVRDPQGRFRGNVYALHDEPLPLGDTLYLDPEHMGFLAAAGEHSHGRVRSVAAAALATIEDDVRRGVDVTGARSSLERRAEALQTLHEQAQGGFYSFNHQRLTELRRTEPPPSSESEDGTPPVTAKNYEDGVCSSSRSFRSKKTTTTTTNDDQHQKISAPAELPADLRFPARLSANHRALALMYLEAVPTDLRQAVLDELEGRLRAERRGAPVVYDPLRFLKKLCEAAGAGSFAPNLGVAVLAERERERQAEARAEQVVAMASPSAPPDTKNPLVRRVLELRAAAAARGRST